MRIWGTAAVVVSVAVITSGGGAISAASASSRATPAVSAAASHGKPVAFNWWRGLSRQRHYIRTTRPRVLGSSSGAPVSSLHWMYWGENSAKGRGLVIHMGRHPVTVYLHDVRVKHGVRYFEKLRETFANHGGTLYLHWSGDWI
jgi:hypothetical protein